MNSFYTVGNIGELYVPVACREAVFARARTKRFAHHELGQLNRVFTHIRQGGVAVVEGDWEQITALMDYMERHKREFSPTPQRDRKSRDRRESRARSVNSAVNAALARLMCWADADGVLQADSAPSLPSLLEFAGEPAGANAGRPFLLPFVTIQQIQRALAERYPVRALDAELLAAENVLAPRSQETVECFQDALRHVRDQAPQRAVDIGCGSGCLTLLARQELGEQVELFASDLLPEAVATTRLNLQRLLPADSDAVRVMPAGDLFAPVAPLKFDLILFNAPWVVARVRNRAERAIHDEKQQTAQRFFAAVAAYLTPDGRVLFGYADASGPKAIANVERMIRESGFCAESVFRRRVATHRSKRKWEQIRVYVLRRDGNNDRV